jgi:hypothetical protein
MAPGYKDKVDAGAVLSFSGKWVSYAHTAFAYGRFTVLEARVLRLRAAARSIGS